MIPETISLEDARKLVLSHVAPLETERVALLDAIGRASAEDLRADIDVSPFAHAAMDGFALRRSTIANASPEHPVELDVVAEVPAGGTYEGSIGAGECVRIMTGAPVPAEADAVVKYEIVGLVSGDGREGSRVSFSAPAKPRANIREAGEEAHAGDVIVERGEIISAAGIGFLAECGILELAVCRSPRVGIIAIGSELVEPPAVPGPGKIRNSNSFAMAACAKAAGATPTMLPVVPDDKTALADAIRAACERFDFVLTTGGACNGDYDFIKPVVENLGELLMTTVNMRPGKAQTFGIVNETPVFGLPGNPAAAFIGFEMLVRPALRVMQGFMQLERPRITARLARDTKKKDPRRLFMRGRFEKEADGSYRVVTAKNQSSGLLGPIQKSNCLVILPEGAGDLAANDNVECVLLDVPEELPL